MPVFFLWDVVYDAFLLPKVALLATGVALAGSLRAAEVLLGAGWEGLRRAALPAAFLAVPALVAWLATDYKAWSVLGEEARLVGLVPMLAAVAGGVLLADAFRGDFRKPAWAFVASGAAVAVYALVQSVGLDPLDLPVPEYAASSIGHSNFVGGFLAIVLPVSLALWTSSAHAARIAGMAATIAIVLGLVLVFSQGAWLAGAAGVAAFAGLALRERYRRAPLAGAAAAAGLAAVGVGLVLLSFVRPFSPLVPDTTRARGFWWRAAVAMGADSPVWGRGPDVYAIEGPHYRPPEDALAHDTLVADEPHSAPLGLFANHGLLGLAGYVLLLVWVVRRFLAARGSPLREGCAAGAIAYFVQSLISVESPLLLFSLWVCIAGLAATGGVEAPAVAQQPARVAPLPAALAVAVAVCVPTATVWWSGSLLAADARVLNAVEAEAHGRPDEALATLEDVLAERDWEPYRRLYAGMLGRRALGEGAAGAADIARMKDAYAYLDGFPNVPTIGAYGGTLHEWSIFDPGEETAALEQLTRLLELDEYSPTGRIAAAEALVRLGRAGEAVEILEFMLPEIESELRGYTRNRPELWGALAVTYFHAGRVDEARAAVEDALDADAGDPPANDCHVIVARELLRTRGGGATRAEYLESSPGLFTCRLATLALLPGYDPQDR
jgi:O-antigen ligase